MMKKTRPVHLNLLKIKLPVTAIASILHRISGVFMVLALPLLVTLFYLSLRDEAGYMQVRDLLQSGVMQLLMAGYLWFLFHHLIAGLRFLLIDLDLGVSKPVARRSAWLVNTVGVLVLVAAVMGVVL